MLIAVYSKDLFPLNDDRIVNEEVVSRKEGIAFFRDKVKKDPLGVWNCHIIDTSTDVVEYPELGELND